MTLLKRSTCTFSSVDRHVLPGKAMEIPQLQETFRSQEMGSKLRRLLLDSGGLATLSLPASCDVWSWGERSSLSLVSSAGFLSQSQHDALFNVLPPKHKAMCSYNNAMHRNHTFLKYLLQIKIIYNNTSKEKMNKEKVKTIIMEFDQGKVFFHS